MSNFYNNRKYITFSFLHHTLTMLKEKAIFVIFYIPLFTHAVHLGYSFIFAWQIITNSFLYYGKQHT